MTEANSLSVMALKWICPQIAENIMSQTILLLNGTLVTLWRCLMGTSQICRYKFTENWKHVWKICLGVWMSRSQFVVYDWNQESFEEKSLGESQVIQICKSHTYRKMVCSKLSKRVVMSGKALIQTHVLIIAREKHPANNLETSSE